MWKILLFVLVGGTILCSDVVDAESDYDPDELNQLENALRDRIDEITGELNEAPREGEDVERSKPLGSEVECPACCSRHSHGGLGAFKITVLLLLSKPSSHLFTDVPGNN